MSTTDPMTRRRFFCALACSVVVAGVTLPIGWPDEVAIDWWPPFPPGDYETWFAIIAGQNKAVSEVTGIKFFQPYRPPGRSEV